MRTFHIIFKMLDTDFISKGENFKAFDVIEAYGQFVYKYPEAEFIALYDLDTLNDIKGGRKERIETTIPKEGTYFKPFDDDAPPPF